MLSKLFQFLPCGDFFVVTAHFEVDSKLPLNDFECECASRCISQFINNREV